MLNENERKRAALIDILDDVFYVLDDEGIDAPMFAEEMGQFLSRVAKSFGWAIVLENT